ncbi:MAG: hypothetical protein DSM106950_40445 [Stigonema ocellatum SAG 48.90 = DSM 106950]|nr:hypothetical protein [Stigonema ocellatum SAG 48.90 = DSM 106950]
MKDNIGEYAVYKKNFALAYTATLYFYERIYVLEVNDPTLIAKEQCSVGLKYSPS